MCIATFDEHCPHFSLNKFKSLAHLKRQQSRRSAQLSATSAVPISRENFRDTLTRQARFPGTVTTLHPHGRPPYLSGPIVIGDIARSQILIGSRQSRICHDASNIYVLRRGPHIGSRISRRCSVMEILVSRKVAIVHLKVEKEYSRILTY